MSRLRLCLSFAILAVTLRPASAEHPGRFTGRVYELDVSKGRDRLVAMPMVAGSNLVAESSSLGVLGVLETALVLGLEAEVPRRDPHPALVPSSRSPGGLLKRRSLLAATLVLAVRVPEASPAARRSLRVSVEAGLDPLDAEVLSTFARTRSTVLEPVRGGAAALARGEADVLAGAYADAIGSEIAASGEVFPSRLVAVTRPPVARAVAVESLRWSSVGVLRGSRAEAAIRDSKISGVALTESGPRPSRSSPGPASTSDARPGGAQGSGGVRIILFEGHGGVARTPRRRCTSTLA
jgi:hypothetical protein